MRRSLAAGLVLAAASASAALPIESQLDGGEWASRPALHPLKGQKLRLRIQAGAGASIRWYRITPDIEKLYHNAGWPWDPDAYKWLGYEKIDYTRCELESLRDRAEIDPLEDDACGADLAKSKHYRAGLGTFWIQAELKGPRGLRRSAGLEGADGREISPRALRISVREGEGYLGWLSSFFNVPAIFGSTLHQSRHYIGVDCADVLMAAHGQWKGRPVERDYNVGSVVARFPATAHFKLAGGEPDKRVEWGRQVRPGDFIAVKYEGARMFQHIGALYADADGDGRLGPEDVVLHAGPEPLHFSKLKDGPFDGQAVVLRPD